MTKHENKGRSAQDIIDDMRNVVKPKIGRMLLEADYEGMGESDQKEFELEFETILTLAETAISQQEQQTDDWIDVNKRLPEDTYPVNITWVNHDPEPYYATIKDKPYTATGCYCDGKWYWYSVSCQDYLDEYGRSDVDAMDEAIEVIAWMPLPKPYELQESEDKE